MKDKLFKNALERGENPCPPIWMMRQAGRYQSSYMAMKQDWSFEQMCKLPRLASDVAMLPIDEFDFDSVDILCGANMLISNKVFNLINCFNEEYFMYGEDIELSKKYY